MMVLDNEQQRKILLQLIAAATIPGTAAARMILALEEDIARASIAPPVPPPA